MFLIVIVSFLRSAMQKYSISPNEKQLVKPLRGLVYHVAKIQKNKRLDFNLLQNRNPTVVYGVVYVETVLHRFYRDDLRLSWFSFSSNPRGALPK